MIFGVIVSGYRIGEGRPFPEAFTPDGASVAAVLTRRDPSNTHHRKVGRQETRRGFTRQSPKRPLADLG
jgi:hypothetical protein